MSYSSPFNTKQIDDNLYVFIDTFNTKLSSDVLIPLLKLMLRYNSKIYFYLTGIVFNKDHIKYFNDEWYHSINFYFGCHNTIININCQYYDLYSNEKINTKIGSYIMQTVGFNSHNIGNIVLVSGDVDSKTRNIPLWKICETSLIWGWKLCVMSWSKGRNEIYNIMNEKYENMYLFNIEKLLKEKEKIDNKRMLLAQNKFQPLTYNIKSPIDQAEETALECIKEFI